MLRSRSFVQVSQRRCFVSSSTITKSAATAGWNNDGAVVGVVSRRAWYAYRKLNPPSVVPKQVKPKEEEKPWPRNMVLTGYAVAAVFIPYSIGWFLSMHADVRRIVASVIPGLEEVLRGHFGHDEYLPYQDLKKNGELPKKKLEDEAPFVVRRQQQLIEALNKEETPLTLHIYKDGGVVTQAVKLPGSSLATRDNLLPKEYDGATIAIDFDDLPTEETNLSDDLVSDFSHASQETLAKNIYSTWFYQHPTDRNERRKVLRTTEQDIEISRLEYMIAQLTQELQNVNSVRDIDDMEQELKTYKGELRTLRWKRRLGIAS